MKEKTAERGIFLMDDLDFNQYAGFVEFTLPFEITSCFALKSL